MAARKRSLVLLLLVPLTLVGCGVSTVDSVADGDTADAEEKPHTHQAGDELVWPVKETIDGVEIWLGHHGDHFHAGETIEPAIAVLKDGTSVDSAKVFCGLAHLENAKGVIGEVATVYEPETENEPAHYAQGELTIPDGVSEFVVRYRINMPAGDAEIVRDVTVKTAH